VPWRASLRKDGGCGGQVSPEVAADLLRVRVQTSMHLYCIGVGQDASLRTLAPLASQWYHVSASPSGDSATVAPLIALAG
jgi:hypothetical protein